MHAASLSRPRRLEAESIHILRGVAACFENPIVPLCFAAVRPAVERSGMLILADDGRLPPAPGEKPMMKKTRFRTLGCYPLTTAIESDAATLPEIVAGMQCARTSERQGRLIGHGRAGSTEKNRGGPATGFGTHRLTVQAMPPSSHGSAPV